MPATIDVLLDEPIATINPLIYSHFIEHLGACIYDGLWRNNQLCPDIVTLLKRLNPPLIRWPGGCFADDYHWRDGIGPRESRPRTVNLHWGQVVESNHFGTHEFLSLCRALNAEPYLSGNVGSGFPRELRDWVEYCNYPSGSTLSDLRRDNGHPDPFRVKYWGVGNEPWGCGGHFSPEDYASEYRRFSTYLRELGGATPFLIAAGPDGNNLDWTRRFFTKLQRDYGKYNRIHGYTPHYYCGTAGAGSATDFTAADWYELLFKAARMEDLIVQQRKVMDEFDPERKIWLMIDEWGTWHHPTPGRNPAFLWQQNTLRDALVAALTLDTFNRHADKVQMSSIAQAVNVLQAPLLAENGKVITTPTYHVYDLYKGHQGGQSLRLDINTPHLLFRTGNDLRRLPQLSGSASTKARTLTLTITNVKLSEPAEAVINLRRQSDAPSASAIIVRETTLTHDDMTAHNTFTSPHTVTLGDPRVMPLTGSSLTYTFAPQSVTRLEMSLS